MEWFESPGIAGGFTTDRDVVRLLLEQKNQLEKMGQQIGSLIKASNNNQRVGSSDRDREFISTNCIQKQGHGSIKGVEEIQKHEFRKALSDHDYAASVESNVFEQRTAKRKSDVLTHGNDFEEVASEVPDVEDKFIVLNERTYKKRHVSTDSYKPPDHGCVSEEVARKFEEEELPEVERGFRVNEQKTSNHRTFYVSTGSEPEHGYVSEVARVIDKQESPPEVDINYNGRREKPDDSDDIRELHFEEEIWDNKSSDLKVGLKFHTRGAVKEFLKMYGDRTNTNMVVSVGGLSSECKSKRLVVKCSYGQGKESIAREDARPNQHSKKLGCSSFIRFYVRGDKNERSLCVIKGFSEVHNHRRTRDMFYQDTQKLRENDELSFVAESMKLHVKPAQLKRCMQEKFQKPGLTTDHVRYVMRKVSGPDQSREQLANLLKKIEDDGGTVEILKQKGSHVVRVLTIQTKEMKRAFRGADPTVVLFDTTFGFCDEGYKMSGFCYSNNLTGHGELVQLVFLADEGAESLHFAFQSFRRSLLNDPKFFMIDKDFTEIQTIKKVFVNSSILLCQFHVLKYMKTLVSTSRAASGSGEKVDIEKKGTLMTSFRATLYAKTEVEAKDCCKKFLAESETIDVRVGNGDQAYYTNLGEYFNKNWETCSDLWMSWRRANIPGLEDNTNNRLERMWRSLKEFLKNSNTGSSSIARAVILLVKFGESQLVDRYTWHQRHRMRIASNDSKFEEELKKAATHLNDGGMLKMKSSLNLLGTKRSNMKVTDKGVVEHFPQSKDVILERELDKVEPNTEANCEEQHITKPLVTARFVSDQYLEQIMDLMSDKVSGSKKRKGNGISAVKRTKKMDNKKQMTADYNCESIGTADYVSQPNGIADYVSEPIPTAGYVSEPIGTAGYVSDPMAIEGYVSEPLVKGRYVSEECLEQPEQRVEDGVSNLPKSQNFLDENGIKEGTKLVESNEKLQTTDEKTRTAAERVFTGDEKVYDSDNLDEELPEVEAKFREFKERLSDNRSYVSNDSVPEHGYVSEEATMAIEKDLPEVEKEFMFGPELTIEDVVSNHSKRLTEEDENVIEGGNDEESDEKAQTPDVKAHTAVENVHKANEKIYKTDVKSCNCSWHIKVGAPCRHILLVRESRDLSLFDPCLFHAKYLKERAFDLRNDSLDIFAQNESEDGDDKENISADVVEDPLDVQQRVLNKGDKFRLFGPKCERLLDAAMRNGTPKARLYEKEFEILINRAKKGESLLSYSNIKGKTKDETEVIAIDENNVSNVSQGTSEDQKFNLLWHNKTKGNKVGRPKESKVKFVKKQADVTKNQKKEEKKSNGNKKYGNIVCSFPYDKDHPAKDALYQRDLESLQPRVFITDGVVDFYLRYSQPNGPLGQTVFLINTSNAQQLESWHWSKIPSLKDLVPLARLYDGGCRIVFMAWCEFSHFFGIVAVCDETPVIYVLESIGRYPEPRGVAVLSNFIQQIRDSKKLPQVTIPSKTLDVPRQPSGSNNCGIFLMKNVTAVLESPEEFLKKAPRNELANWYPAESLANGRSEIIATIRGLQKAQTKSLPNFEEMLGLQKSSKVRHDE